MMAAAVVAVFAPAAGAQTAPALRTLGELANSPASVDEPVTEGESPPIEVLGTIIAHPIQMVVVEVLDSAGQATATRRLRTGDSVEGYRVVVVEPDRVTFEREGRRFVVPVGRTHGRKPAQPDALGQGLPGAIFVPGSVAPVPDLPYRGPREGPLAREVPPGSTREPPTKENQESAEPLLEKVLGDPEFRQRLEQMRPILRRQLEERSGITPSTPAPTLPPPQPGGNSPATPPLAQ